MMSSSVGSTCARRRGCGARPARGGRAGHGGHAAQRPQVGGVRGSRCGRRRLAVRDVQGAARLQPSGRAAPSRSRSRGCPPGSGASHRRAVHQLRRAGRQTRSPRRRRSAPTCSARSTTTSTSSPSIRAASARARPRSTARSTRRPRASTRSRSRRPRTSTSKALLAKDKAYVKRCVEPQQGILPYASTANVARDMDGIRAAMGDKKLNYFGFSYGTFLGATYASLFPDNYRAMVLDGPVDANSYINNPRPTCASRPPASSARSAASSRPARSTRSFCQFGGDDPWAAFDALVDAGQPARRSRRPASPTIRGRSTATTSSTARSSRSNQGQLAAARQALAEAQRRRRDRHLRYLADASWGNNFGRHVRPGHRPLLHDRRDRADVPARHRRRSSTPATTRGGCSTTSGSTRATPRSTTALWPIHDKDAFTRPVHAPRSRRRRCSRSRRRMTRPRRSAARSGSRPSSATSAS